MTETEAGTFSNFAIVYIHVVSSKFLAQQANIYTERKGMLIQIGLGLFMTAITICCGALAIVVTAVPLRRYRTQLIDQGRFTSHLIVLTLVSTWLVLSMLALMLIWGFMLQLLGVFADIQTSLYFAMISFTTVGYGDVIPPANWRILAGFISVDGFLLFGLNTAFVFEVLRRMRGDHSGYHVGR